MDLMLHLEVVVQTVEVVYEHLLQRAAAAQLVDLVMHLLQQIIRRGLGFGRDCMKHLVKNKVLVVFQSKAPCCVDDKGFGQLIHNLG